MDGKLRDALMDLGIHPDCVDEKKLSQEISEHMLRGLRGIGGSMMMIPTYLFGSGTIVPDEPVAVIDAGGTNLRAATVVIHSSGAEVIEIKKSRMPGTDRQITAEEMYDEFVKRIMPMMPASGRLALCFSYAFRSMPDGEAQIITMGKEISIEDCEGSLIREGMLRAFAKAGYKGDPKITVLNDTAAVLYSALASGYNDAVGFILGTGMNTAYFEKTRAVPKIGPVLHDRVAINMESAYFSSPPCGMIDRKLDSASRNKGQALFEKMVSGVYLGEIACLSVIELAERGLMSDGTADRVRDTGALKLQHVTELIERSSGPLAELCACNEDIKTLRELFICIMRRSGKMTASLVAAVIRRICADAEEKEVPVAVNGSTFLLNRTIREEFVKCLNELAGSDFGFKLISRDDDTLVGSAAAAFLG